MAAKIIDGTAIAHRIRQNIADRIVAIKESGKRPPCLAVILVGNDPASEIYVGHKKKACAAVGIESRSITLDANISQPVLLDQLRQLNDDKTIDGILLQLPLPRHLDRLSAIDMISPEKDVDGLTPVNQGLLVWQRDTGLYSCTPLGVMELIRSTGVKIEGKLAVVLGRSVLVGAPTCNLLSNAGATVTSLHSKSLDKPALTRTADIVVVATGVHHLVQASWIKPGAIVIDVGMHRHGAKLSGDVDFDGVSKVAGYITPVPGGVGPMTIAMLLQNCLRAYERRYS